MNIYEKYTKPADMNKDLNLYIAQYFTNPENKNEIYSWSGVAREISNKGTLKTQEKLMDIILIPYTIFPDLEENWSNIWEKKGVTNNFIALLRMKLQFQTPPSSPRYI